MSSTSMQGAGPPGEDSGSRSSWHRSLERSRARRAAAAVSRRRRIRSRGATLSAVAVVAASGFGASAAVGHDTSSYGEGSAYTGTYLTVGSEGEAVSALEQALGVSADGYFDEATARSVRNYQAENGLSADGIVGPETAGALGLNSGTGAAGTGESSSDSSGGGATSATLEQIAQCESGGDPTAVSADGQYRGKYQFSMETWRAMGGTGDPAAAPEAEQDRIAAELLAQSGTSSWPNCA